MKVFLHIGQQKTGSTSLQKFLEINRANLIKQDFVYPKSLGKNKHFSLLKNTAELVDSNSKLHKDFFQEIKKSKSNNLILSEENLFTLRDELLDQIALFLNSHFKEIIIIVYLRRQYDQAPSFYQEVVKGKVHLKYEKWLGKKIEQGYYNYFEVMRRWEDRFPNSNIQVKAFHNLYQNDVRQDFLQSINIEDCTALNFDESENFKNTSVDSLSIELLRISNAFAKSENAVNPSKITKQVREYIANKPFSKKLVLHYHQKLRLWETSLDSNEKLLAKYNSLEKSYFREPPKEVEGWTNDDHSAEEVLSALNKIYPLN